MSGPREWAWLQRPWEVQLREGAALIAAFTLGGWVLETGVSLSVPPGTARPWLDAIAALSALGATVGGWLFLAPKPGLEGPRVQTFAMLMRRFLLFWAGCAVLAALDDLPMLKTYEEAGFIGRQLGRAIVYTLGLVYLRLFLHTMRCHRSADAATVLACLYAASYGLEIVLYAQPNTPNLGIALQQAFLFELVVGASSIAVLLHARKQIAHSVDADTPP